MLAEILCTHLYLVFIQESWTLVDSLPLHLCRLSFIVAGLTMISKSQGLYEWSVYLGLASGFHSIVTPELTQGDSPWMLFDYYVSHSLLMAIPIILSVFFGRVPRRWAAFRMFLYVNAIAVIVFAVNLATGANYMYLSDRPVANSPLLVGPWPWYLLGLQVVLIVHLIVVDVLFRVFPQRAMRRRHRIN